MKWIGITGGIATGKSTVAQILRDLGYVVLDADRIAHGALGQDSSVYHQIIKEFGEEILDSNKKIDRKRLGQIVFGNPEKLDALEKLVHPFVQQQVQNEKKLLLKKGEKLVFYDVPLLFEKNLESQFDAVIVVACNESLQKKRLQERNKLSDEEIAKRLAAQIPIAEKIKKTKYIIKNEGSVEQLKTLTKQLLSFLKKI